METTSKKKMMLSRKHIQPLRDEEIAGITVASSPEHNNRPGMSPTQRPG